jgi:GDP-4-dehydro-6-deoxy-D-mannose reductase
MKVLVTGASGFAGRWLKLELEQAGHVVVAAPGHQELDLADAPDLRPLFESERPEAVAHLAAVSFAPDAARDPEFAARVNVGGTRAVFTALDAAGSQAAVLVTSSSEVYGRFETGDLPISESLPLRATGAYGRSKIEQENVALEASARRPIVITRAFNHIGPGQRDVFVAPAIARRVIAFRAGRANAVSVGNVDVRRDLTDVRDTVRAYRLLLEALFHGRVPQERPIYNVATGRSVPIRTILEMLCDLAGVPVVMEVEPSLVRESDATDVRGDASALRTLTGWAPTIPLETSLADLLTSVERSTVARSRGSRCGWSQNIN